MSKNYNCGERSPFFPYHNAVIQYAKATSYGIDPYTGNTIQIPGVEVDYKAFFKPETDEIKEIYSPGSDQNRVYLRGYLVEPMQLEIELPATLPGYIITSNGISIDGFFELKLIIRSAADAERYTGQKIECYFSTNTNVKA